MHFVMSRQPGIQCLFGGGFALPAMVMLASCATPVPQAWTPKIVPAAFSESSPNLERVWPSPQWWQAFGSPRLSELIDEAEADNQDLAVATARVSEARAQITVQRSAYFPQLTGQSLAQRASGSTTQSAGDQPNATSNAFGVNIGASYELDVWGLAHAGVRAATESLKSARFARETVALTLTANVANV